MLAQAAPSAHQRRALATTAAAAPAPCRPAPPRRAAAVRARAASQSKVNKRGKVASRPGPQSSGSKQARDERLARRLQQDDNNYAGGVEDDASPSAAPLAADAAPVDPSLDAGAAAASSPAAPSPASSSSVPSSTPQVVVDRMFRRIIVSAGVPVLLGLAMLPVFYYARVVAKLEWLPPWLVYVASGGAFGGGLLGITYGILSTSWEPRREGSALGFDEFKANVALLASRRGGGSGQR
jgi:hypothetical protein